MPENLRHSCLQIFEERADLTLSSQGSGILVSRKGCYWLVTAAHVLLNFGPRRYFFLAGLEIMGVPDIVVSSRPLADESDRDPYDLALVGLRVEIADALTREGHSFYPISDETIVRGYRDFGEVKCVLAGFPDKLTDIDSDEGNISSKCMVYVCNVVKETKVRVLRIDPKIHVCVEYEARQGPKKNRAPAPAGASGGALWVQSDDRWLLAALVVQHDKKKKFIVATRLGRVFAEIYHQTRE